MYMQLIEGRQQRPQNHCMSLYIIHHLFVLAVSISIKSFSSPHCIGDMICATLQNRCALFAWLKSHGKNCYSLICCERKTLLNGR